jgi:hypothetical protein
VTRIVVLIWVATWTLPVWAQTKIVSGQMGILGEWELTATLSVPPDGARTWSGPVSLKHVGFCSIDGPEEKQGEMRLTEADAANELTATIVIDGTSCAFTGHPGDVYEGMIRCPDRRDLPMTLMMR